jgi:metal-sulfur cluster biosynthetic enzyme
MATLNANPTIHPTSALPHASEGGHGLLDGFSDGAFDAVHLPFLSSAVVCPPSAFSSGLSFSLEAFFPLASSSSSLLPSAGARVSGSSPPPCPPPREPWDSLDVFELVRSIQDPEHPLTLEQLNVTQLHLIRVDDSESSVDLRFTPTIPHCSMATLIGLCLRVQLLRSLPQRFKVDIRISEGSHSTEEAINKQLNDKERVAAALENAHLLDIVNRCVGGEGGGGEK